MRFLINILLALLLAAPAFAGSGSDAFSRADNLDLGSEWDPYENPSGTGHPCEIVSNEVVATIDADRCTEVYNAYIPTAAQYAKANIVILDPVTPQGGDVGLLIRGQTPPTYSAYLCRINNAVSGNDSTQIQKRVAGVNTLLATDNSITWADGDEIRCEATGSTLTLYQNGVSVLSAVDSQFSSGRAGVFVQCQSGVSTSCYAIDDFEVGDLGAATRRRSSPVIFR